MGKKKTVNMRQYFDILLKKMTSIQNCMEV